MYNFPGFENCVASFSFLMFPYAFSGEFQLFRVTLQMLVHLDYLKYKQKSKFTFFFF